MNAPLTLKLVTVNFQANRMANREGESRHLSRFTSVFVHKP